MLPRTCGTSGSPRVIGLKSCGANGQAIIRFASTCNTASCSGGLEATQERSASRTIIDRKRAMIPKNRKPSHPGEILLTEFLEPLQISQVELAKRMGVPVQRVNT